MDKTTRNGFRVGLKRQRQPSSGVVLHADTVGQNLLAAQSSEFSGSSATLVNLQQLGLRALNPEEVETNMLAQMEQQMAPPSGQLEIMGIPLLTSFFNPRNEHLQLTRQELDKMIRLTAENAKRQSHDRNGKKKRTIINIKEQVLRALNRSLYPPTVDVVVDSEPSEPAKKRKPRDLLGDMLNAKSKKRATRLPSSFAQASATNRRAAGTTVGAANRTFVESNAGSASATRSRTMTPDSSRTATTSKQNRKPNTSASLLPTKPTRASSKPTRSSAKPTRSSANPTTSANPTQTSAKPTPTPAKPTRRASQGPSSTGDSSLRLKIKLKPPKRKTEQNVKKEPYDVECPICSKGFYTNNGTETLHVEEHIDKCLERSTEARAAMRNKSYKEASDDEGVIVISSSDEYEPDGQDQPENDLVVKSEAPSGDEYDNNNNKNDSDDDDNNSYADLVMSDDDDDAQVNFLAPEQDEDLGEDAGPEAGEGRRQQQQTICYDDDYDEDEYLRRVVTYFRVEARWGERYQSYVDAGRDVEDAEQAANDDLLNEDWEAELRQEVESGGLDAIELTPAEDVNYVHPDRRRTQLGAPLERYARRKYAECVKFVDLEHANLRVPRRLFSNLFDYQRTGVNWLAGLRSQGAGGIIGDEMGLGKTVQIAAYLAALKSSGKLGPTLILCPATTLSQWVQEIHKWHPTIRVLLMHSSGASIVKGWSRKKLVGNVARLGDVVITTYQGVRGQSETVLPIKWGNVILDEGHKIRNPDADITLVCKQLQTVNRLILSGAPIQNHLKELWSLFDFVFPGRLGTLPMFENQFSIPINVGGYSNATPMQVQMAYKCAMVLKETINPYLLRRMKKDVASVLPKKVEQVLFCNITLNQRAAYESYLQRSDVQDIIYNRTEHKRSSFKAIRDLQKICNHPDLVLHDKPEDCGAVARSGKMLVLKSILEMWYKQGHRVLLFSQGTIMLDILEQFVREEGYPYFRMDGTTAIKNRQPLIDKFNNPNTDVFVFCLTTRVGGLGTNLIGANRVLIYDPDWNPSTDMQARERAWRLGQKRAVTIYRLITSGTIEEKIYHRQIFKQFLTNKILHDPRQKRFFKFNDLRDLFSLAPDATGQRTATGDSVTTTETTDLFRGGRVEVQPNGSDPVEEEQQGASSERDASTPSLQAIDGISKVDTRPEERDVNDEAKDAASQDGNDDDHHKENNAILQAIFDGHGFRQAFDHETVEEASRNNPEKQILQQEASRVARRAAERLRQEQRRCRREASNVHIPTWTGQRGGIGGPPGVAGGGLSSASLLQHMRNRSWMSGDRGSGDEDSHEEDGPPRPMVQVNAPSMTPEEARHTTILKELRAYLMNKGSRATTKNVLQHFRTRMKESEAHIFREMLREMAELDGGVWYLKSSYM